MVGWLDARHVQWPTVGGAQQPGNLRAKRNTVIDRRNADAGDRYLALVIRKERFERKRRGAKQ
jgi:hypothetical protein